MGHPSSSLSILRSITVATEAPLIELGVTNLRCLNMVKGEGDDELNITLGVNNTCKTQHVVITELSSL